MIRAPSIGLLLQPGCDRRVVVVAHRRNDHVVGARGISPVEACEILRNLDLQRRIQESRGRDEAPPPARRQRRHAAGPHVAAGSRSSRCLHSGRGLRSPACPARRGFMASTKACICRSAIAALACAGGTGAPPPQPASANAPLIGLVSAHLIVESYSTSDERSISSGPD